MWTVQVQLEEGARAQCQVEQLVVSEIVKEDDFGRTVAMDGDVVAIGAVSTDVPGVVRVFRRQGYEWIEEAVLMAPIAETLDEFGGAIDLVGDYLVVGAPRYDYPEPAIGAVFVYRYDETARSWILSATLHALDGEEDDRFGSSVSLNPDRQQVIVGARRDTVDGFTFAGSAYIFEYDDEEWVETAHLFEPLPDEGNLFGSVDILGDLAFVGAHGTDAAYLYQQTDSGWKFKQELIPQSPSFASWFGRTVALSAERILVGAPDSGNGLAFLFTFDSETDLWKYETTLEPSDPVGFSNNFSNAISFGANADTMLIGASNDSEAAGAAGAVYIIHDQSDGTLLSTKIFADDATPSDCFGRSVSASGDFAVVGAPCRDPGSVYFFTGITPVDCNENDEPDGCDIFSGASFDEDEDGVPDECVVLVADFDRDGDVDFADLLQLLDSWGLCKNRPCPADLDRSGDVGFSDLIILLDEWT